MAEEGRACWGDRDTELEPDTVRARAIDPPPATTAPQRLATIQCFLPSLARAFAREFSREFAFEFAFEFAIAFPTPITATMPQGICRKHAESIYQSIQSANRYSLRRLHDPLFFYGGTAIASIF
ncbi:MAG: hypothetical protein AAF685_05780 [Cyanobacteria bacterium P01_C01_bin.89]